MKIFKAAIIILLLATSSSLNAYPLLGTSGFAGQSSCHPVRNHNYTVQFDNAFGGHWNLKGNASADGSYRDDFRGTVTDTIINRTFTQADFDWISDGWFLCTRAQVMCSTFSITISNGKVTGW